jgi:hypothetical protein
MKSVGSSTAVHDEVNGLILVEWHSQGYGHSHSCNVHFDGARTDIFCLQSGFVEFTARFQMYYMFSKVL